jgi:hypothetical protein
MTDNFFKIRRKEIIICMLLVAIPLFVYLQVINYDFVYYDDNSYVTENPHVKAGLTLEKYYMGFYYLSCRKLASINMAFSHA